jgi:DNA-directed RNA polymerase subunit RPC12/RpoP
MSEQKHCQRSKWHDERPATHIMERGECPKCGHREVLYVCDDCTAWACRVSEYSSIRCVKCGASKSDWKNAIKILGKA